MFIPLRDHQISTNPIELQNGAFCFAAPTNARSWNSIRRDRWNHRMSV